MLRVYKDNKHYPRKVIDDEGKLYFCALDDDMIEIDCSFDRMKKHMNENISINVRYNIDKKSAICSIKVDFILML